MSLFDSAVTSGFSAPFWFVEFFKTLGFALHLIPIGILLAGIPFAGLLWLLGDVNSKRLAQKIISTVRLSLWLWHKFCNCAFAFRAIRLLKRLLFDDDHTCCSLGRSFTFVFLAYLACYLCASGARREKNGQLCFCLCCFLDVCWAWG